MLMIECAGCDDCAFTGEDVPTDFHEIHITVDALEHKTADFVAACEELGVKPIVISYNNRDNNTSALADPMTSHKFRGTEVEALREAKRISEGLNFAGFYPIRCKIETTPTNPIVEQGKGYFESHIGIGLPKDRIEDLRVAAKSLGAHVSANAFKDHGETVTQMVTVRANARDTTPAKFQYHMLWMQGMLDSMADFNADKLIVEYCWYDSNRDHDLAWMGEWR